MALIRKTNWFDIYIEEGREVILIRQKWKYSWFSTTNSSWTIRQKINFHNSVDSIIWKTWRYYYKIKVKGNSYFAKKHKNSSFTVNFDIQWVLNSEHWNVKVTKIASGKFMRSSVEWNNRIINLDTEDTKLTYKGNSNGRSYYQVPVAHEFGHAVGNSYWALKGSKRVHGDEYSSDNRINGGFSLDYESIMNIGNTLRDRHIDYILKELNSMMPNTIFYL